MPVAAPNQKADQFPKAPASAGAFGRFAPSFRAPEPAGPFAALAELAGRPLLWAVLAVLVLAGYGYAMAVPAVDMDDLAIDPDQDYCTLVTCTPYGINTQRLLVRGHRIPNRTAAQADAEPQAEATSPIRIAVIAAIVVAVAAIATVVTVRLVRHRR